MTHIFFGYTKNCRRVAKELGIPNPVILQFPEAVLSVRGDVAEHICLPWEGSDQLHDARGLMHEICKVTTTYHIL